MTVQMTGHQEMAKKKLPYDAPGKTPHRCGASILKRIS